MKPIATIALLVAFLTVATMTVCAQQPLTQATPTATQGEIRKVDKAAKKVTIRHAPLVHLDMPAMTMVFQVQDPAVLDQVKVGDKVRFVAEKREGAFILTEIEVDRR